MASWKKTNGFTGGERVAHFVKHDTMWDPQKRLTQNKAVMVCPEMDPKVGPMLKDVLGNVIIYDYFIRSGTFYLISTYWSEASPRLAVLVNDNPVTEHGYQEYMATRYFTCPMPDTGLVWVTINGVKYELMPDIIKPLVKKHRFGIVLNFKHESAAWVKRFLKYYRGQGVDAFYFYYNGAVLPADLPVGNDIIYRTWECPFKIHTNRFIHSAQTVAYISFRWRYYDDCEWVAAIDLDEFICDAPELGLVADILGNMAGTCDVVMINNFWATVGPEGGVFSYCRVPCGFAFDNGRTKCIFNTRNYRGTWGIHLPKADCKLIKSNRLVFYHVIDCLHPERKDLIRAPIDKTRRFGLPKL